MVDIFNAAASKREIEQDAYRYYEQLSGTTLARAPDGSFRGQGHNDALDAFRHAYTSGRVTQIALGVQAVSRHFGDGNEVGPAHPNEPYEHRMDLWNNEVGRRLGDDTGSKDELARRAYAAIGDGTLVTGLDDPRLRQLFPDDPRLRRPEGHPERELLTQPDVDRINRDVGRALDSRQAAFQPGHPDYAMYRDLRARVPGEIPDDRVAQALLQAKQDGITGSAQIADVRVQDNRIFVLGTTPGFRSTVDMATAAPPMSETVYETNALNARAAQHDAQQAAQPARAYGQ